MAERWICIMNSDSEVDSFREVYNDVVKAGRNIDEQIPDLVSKFGSRFDKAWKTVVEGRVKKYIFKPSGRIIWIVVGKGRDYLVLPNAEFCLCEDFYFKFDKGHLCYHIIAQKIAEFTGRFNLIEDEDSFYDIFLDEWKNVETKISKKIKKKDASRLV